MGKHVLCASCDVHCQVSVETPASGDMKDVKVKAMDPGKFRANICIKGINAPQGFDHKNRVLKPLKRVGERGSGQWEEVSWDEAMSDIAERLKEVTRQYGPEAFAMSSSPALVQNDYGMGRRFMNVLGSPNYISGV
ncbi:MAG: molybdopterin-dependent oxidoreductase, partial [Sneathiellales bacterium]|nr:molybdopterin-dependent oxidoreductase [Sneathiellales bacterium]